MNNYQEYIHVSRYARWRDEDGRRETWDETVERYISHFRQVIEDCPASKADKKKMLEELG